MISLTLSLMLLRLSGIFFRFVIKILARYFQIDSEIAQLHLRIVWRLFAHINEPLQLLQLNDDQWAGRIYHPPIDILRV